MLVVFFIAFVQGVLHLHFLLKIGAEKSFIKWKRKFLRINARNGRIKYYNYYKTFAVSKA